MIEEALAFLRDRELVALTGAGLSTDSGIPDYRGPQAPVRLPMTYQEFVSGPAAQQRYWARSHIGWQRMGRALPNDGHRALVALERQGRLRLLITQNVDGLHEAAGSVDVVALHGRVADVICLDCGAVSSRERVQGRLDALNPGWIEAHAHVVMRPDGDVELDETSAFALAACDACGGRLKPDVVYFGENVPRPRVERAMAAVEALEPATGALLVVGSSLTVMSGLRFVRAAAKRSVPVVVVNRGATRGDDLATLKVEAGASEFLTALSETGLSETYALS